MEKLTRYPLANAEFVAGEGELCFKDVINDFSNAKHINILTYNISTNNNALLNAIKTVGKKGIPITIITNIPNRWEEYGTQKSDAKKIYEIIYEEIHDASYGIYCDYDTNFIDIEYFDLQNNYISWKMLEELMEAIYSWKNLIRDMETELANNYKEYNETELKAILDEYSNFIDEINDEINDLCYKLEDLAKFDEDDITNNLLSNEYYSEAYDENLDCYAQLAVDE